MEKEALVNIYFFTNFNYWSLVWHFSTKKGTNKIEKIRERCLKLQYNNNNETHDDLIVKTSQLFMEIKRLRTLATGFFKILNGIKSNFVKEIFYLSPHETNKKYDLFVHSRNTTEYGSHSLRVPGPYIWNSLPEEIKKLFSSNAFKKVHKKLVWPKK